MEWSKVDLKERSAAQEHFIDLCRLVGHPTPAEADPTGDRFCFEKGAAKHGGGDGFADVWYKDHFGWEYKGRHKDLDAAFDQLLLYKDDLANPPLLVVCDFDRIAIRTNFTGTVPVTYDVLMTAVGDARNLEILRCLFFAPEKLKPGRTSDAVTQDAADRFAVIAESMRKRGLEPGASAHFLDRIVFCLFAEDIGLLPDMIFSRITERAAGDPARFTRLIGQLFQAMAQGGDFGLDPIRHFNGNLFDGDGVPNLTLDEIKRIAESSRLDWSAVNPTIFGTLFLRGMDPAKRSQLGAEFTGKADIEDVVDNVIMRVLHREWDETRGTVENLLITGKKVASSDAASAASGPRPALSDSRRRKARGEAASLLHAFLTRLQSLKILDPACGSGNFLYVALLKLKDLEKEVILYAMENDLGGFLPMVGPWQLHGIEINPYAHDLAQMTVWIGWLQWIRFNGFGQPQEPILRPMSANFRCMDAIMETVNSGSGNDAKACDPEWPTVDFVIGNPPFLGGKMLRRELGDVYVDRLLARYKGRVPAEADLCCYWFEKARAMLEAGRCKRVGLLATQGIRGGANREVLKRIKDTGEIVWAVSDRDWILDGANVHVSMVGFGPKTESGERLLDGHAVAVINANLSSQADTTQARVLDANTGIAFMGDTKGGPFEVPESLAREWLTLRNPNGESNADVVRPWANGLELTRVPQRLWIVDFDPEMTEHDAAQYEAPFEHIKQHVKPMRAASRTTIQAWWLHERPRPDLRAALTSLPRYLATPRVSKHRLFVWMDAAVLPDSALIAFARDDDFFFGVLHSRLHEVWALRMGTQLEDRPRYTPTTCFETFPFPPLDRLRDPVRPTSAIAAAAKALHEARQNWLGDRSDATRTLTALYNRRPDWLLNAHQTLDAAVFAAYSWPTDLTDAQILERLLALNLERAKW